MSDAPKTPWLQRIWARLWGRATPHAPPPAADRPNEDTPDVLLRLFLYLREQHGFTIGMDELLDAQRCATDPLVTSGTLPLKSAVRLLFCTSRDDTRDFDDAWDTLFAASAPAPAPADADAPSPPPSAEPAQPDHGPEPPPAEVSDDTSSASALAPLPVQAPPTRERPDDPAGLETNWPLTPRAMHYAWRYLRRPVADGPRTVLDIDATIERATREGFFREPVLRRSIVNHAHLVLFIDQRGSMEPLHRFVRDLQSSAEASTIETKYAYFHDVPTDGLYATPALAAPRTECHTMLEQLTGDTSVLIVSDAGAARGSTSTPRVRDTVQFLVLLERRTTLVAWLNPMPQDRWDNTSAELIASVVPMFPMTPDGLSNAIDVLRGQVVQSS